MHPNKRKASTDLSSQAKKPAVDAPLPTEYIPVETESDALCVNTIRCVAPALPLQAKAGHPGAPMGCALMAHLLWGSVMNYSPKHSGWPNRDRFVLSNGHACALQYLMLYLSGYKITLDDLKKFRQISSITPGHPEVHITEGVEVTTGPLGQGIAQAVGLAIGQANLAATYNRDDFPLFTNYTYCIVGDGCMQEGIASEACSLAGHLGLGNLIVFYDDNKISIDGDTTVAFTEDVAKRFEAYGWHVQWIANGNQDLKGLAEAVEAARKVTNKPSLIGVRTIIAYGSKIQGTGKSHGAPLALEDIQALRKKCGLSEDVWDIPNKVVEFYRKRAQHGDGLAEAWDAMYKEYKSKFSKEWQELDDRLQGKLPKNWESCLPQYKAEDKPDATRNLSQKCLQAVHRTVPGLIGGSADLMESNKTHIPDETDFQANNKVGRYLRFGVREHAMVAICNGLAAYGGFRPFAATFLNFYTYAWGAVRLTALSQLGVGMIASHDSIDLGEDGPTHQPIETIPLMRATPNLLLVRPADGNEVSGAYRVWITNHKRPTVLALSRSSLPQLPHTSADGVLKGAYVLRDFSGKGTTKVCLAGSGSETQHCLGAADILIQKGFDVRVVSMPCWELFDEQTEEYKRSVIPHKKDAVCAYIEAASTFGFARFFEEEASIGMNSFGNSGSSKALMERFGFNAKTFADKVTAWIEKNRS